MVLKFPVSNKTFICLSLIYCSLVFWILSETRLVVGRSVVMAPSPSLFRQHSDQIIVLHWLKSAWQWKKIKTQFFLLFPFLPLIDRHLYWLLFVCVIYAVVMLHATHPLWKRVMFGFLRGRNQRKLSPSDMQSWSRTEIVCECAKGRHSASLRVINRISHI